MFRFDSIIFVRHLPRNVPHKSPVKEEEGEEGQQVNKHNVYITLNATALENSLSCILPTEWEKPADMYPALWPADNWV